MSISVNVHLLSGKTALLEVEADASAESLKQRAQSALATGRGRLLNSSGDVLDGAKTITEAKLKSGDELTLHVKPVQLMATRTRELVGAFIAILGDGDVVTWGRSPGVLPTTGATAAPYRSSCEMCSRFKLLALHSPQF